MPPSDPAPGWRQRLGSPESLVLLSVVGILLWRASQLPVVALVFLGVAGIAALLVLLCRGWAALLGPMFFYDLLCSSRRGKYIAVRCIYAFCLLAAIFGVYASWFGAGSFGYPLPQNLVTRFANSFFTTFLGVQLVAVFLLTPVFSSGAIAEEKERRRLDFLLVTELHDHEIVLGKLASRLATVGLMLLTGLPVLGLMQFLGGVDPNLVLAGFTVTLFTMLSLGGIGIWMSSVCDKPTNAMWFTYLILLGYLGFCWCPPGFNLGHPGVLYNEIERSLPTDRDLSDVLLERVAIYGAFHLLVSVVSVLIAIYCLRPERAIRWPAGGVESRRSPAIPPREVPKPPPPVFPPPGPPLVPFPGDPRPRPPIDEDRPLLWKELHLEQEKSHDAVRVLVVVLALFFLFVIGMVCLTAILEAVQRGRPIGEVTNPMARALGTILGCFMLLGIVFTAVGSVSREREQHTLESLLTLPIDRNDILRAKWYGSVLSIRRLAWGLAGIWGFALVTGGLHIFAVPLLVLNFLAHVSFAASLGLWFSVASTSKVQATLRALLTLFAVMVLSVVLNLDATTPMASLWMLAFSPRDRFIYHGELNFYSSVPKTEPGQLMLGLVGAITYALVSLILWDRTCERFRAEKGEVGREPAA